MMYVFDLYNYAYQSKKNALQFVFIGSARKLELRIRLFCRNVLLDHWTHRSDSAFWLTCILKPWPMVNQARLLYIIFGPISPQDGEHLFLRDVCFKAG